MCAGGTPKSGFIGACQVWAAIEVLKELDCDIRFVVGEVIIYSILFLVFFLVSSFFFFCLAVFFFFCFGHFFLPSFW